MRRTKMFLAGLLVSGLVGGGGSLGAAASPKTRTHSGGGVTVKVTALDSKTKGDLRFQVVLDTHSVDLDAYDFKTIAVLRDDSAKSYSPTRVENKGSGHHREEVLSFPKSFTIRNLLKWSKDPMTFTSALKHFVRRNNARWIWRCHIDSSEPNPRVWSFLKPFTEEYDEAVFTMEEFCPPDLKISRRVFIPPAIDPLSTKNKDLPKEVCKRALANSGVDLRRPLLLQVSRFDPLEGPVGSYKRLSFGERKSVLEFNLRLLGRWLVTTRKAGACSKPSTLNRQRTGTSTYSRISRA